MKTLARVDENGWVVTCGTFDVEEPGMIEVPALVASAMLSQKVRIEDGQPVYTGISATPPGKFLTWNSDAGQWLDQRSLEVAWAAVRFERDERISRSDWVVLPDVTLPEPLRTQWLDYRQALRDVTQQPDPRAITWPIPPA